MTADKRERRGVDIYCPKCGQLSEYYRGPTPRAKPSRERLYRRIAAVWICGCFIGFAVFFGAVAFSDAPVALRVVAGWLALGAAIGGIAALRGFWEI